MLSTWLKAIWSRVQFPGPGSAVMTIDRYRGDRPRLSLAVAEARSRQKLRGAAGGNNEPVSQNREREEFLSPPAASLRAPPARALPSMTVQLATARRAVAVAGCSLVALLIACPRPSLGLWSAWCHVRSARAGPSAWLKSSSAAALAGQPGQEHLGVARWRWKPPPTAASWDRPGKACIR